MVTFNLDIRHPAYQATEAVRLRARDLYDGADAIKAKGETYLFKGSNETDAAYDIRSKRAVYEPLVRKVITARQALLFRKPAARDLPSTVKEYAADVDLKSTAADTFFEQTAREAQIEGIAWVCVDMPRIPEGGYRSKAEEEAARHRPFFELIHAGNVLDWEVAPDKSLLWAVVKQTRPVDRFAPGINHDSVDQWKIWYRDRWEIYEQGAKNGSELVDQGQNTSGVVPLVPFYGVLRTDYSGWPVIRDILDHALLIYNKASDLDWFEYLLAHPIPFTVSPDKPQVLDAGRGLWINSAHADGATIQMAYLEPTGQGFNSIRESIREIRNSLFSTALAQAKRDSAQVQSADSQREDRREFASSLMSVSLATEKSEQRCWDLMARWKGDANAQAKVNYNRDFDDALIDSTMISTMSSLVLADQITLETFLNTLKDGERLPADFDVTKELETLSAQAAARATTVTSPLEEDHTHAE